MSDDSKLIDRYDRLTNDINEIYQKSEDILGQYIYDDNRDAFIDPWSEMTDVLGLDILLEVAKVNRQVQNED